MTLGPKDFVFKEEIGRGAYGVVHKVKCKRDNRIYCIKQIDTKHLKKRESDAHKEVRVLEKIKHPNIIQYYASFSDKKGLYIVMEYADGGDLHKKIKMQKKNKKHFSEQDI